MNQPRSVRLGVPAVAIVLLVWAMVGCIYIPTPERLKLTGARRDFRDVLGPGSGDGLRIVAGRVTRGQVVALLGEPAYRTADGRSAVYTMTSGTGLYVIPLCFDLTSDREAQYAVRVDYAADGVVAAYQLESVSHALKPVQLESEQDRPHDEYVNDAAAERLDRGGDLRRTDAAYGLPLHDSRHHPFHLDPATRPQGE